MANLPWTVFNSKCTCMVNNHHVFETCVVTEPALWINVMTTKLLHPIPTSDGSCSHSCCSCGCCFRGCCSCCSCWRDDCFFRGCYAVNTAASPAAAHPVATGYAVAAPTAAVAASVELLLPKMLLPWQLLPWPLAQGNWSAGCFYGCVHVRGEIQMIPESVNKK